MHLAGGVWQAIEFDDQWRAVAVMQGAWVRDWTQQGRRTDLTAQAEPLLPSLPPLQPPDQQQPLPDPAALHPTPQPPPMPWVPRESFTCAGLTDKPPRFWRSLVRSSESIILQLHFTRLENSCVRRFGDPKAKAA